MVDPALGQKLSECGRALAMATVPAITSPAGVHVQTMIAGCARMAGTYLFRSFNLQVQDAVPGQVALSAEAAAHSPALLQTCAGVLKELGTAIASAPTGPLNDKKHRPTQDFLQTQRILEPVFAPLQGKFALNNRQMAHAAAIGTALLIHHFAKHLDPNVGFGVAAFAFTEGSRTVPATHDQGGSAA